MKKIRLFAFTLLLLLVLSACGSNNKTDPSATDPTAENVGDTFLPEVTAAAGSAQIDLVPESDETQELLPDDVPLDESDQNDTVTAENYVPEYAEPVTENEDDVPTEAEILEGEIANYLYTTLDGSTFGFSYVYPSHWTNFPGKYTACFQEPVAEGDVPARVAVTKKHMPHVPNTSTLLNQFKAYAQVIYNTYPSDTFQWGKLNENATFMGSKAKEITYLAYSGNIEVKGYMICCSVDHEIYVFHFVCPYNDYTVFEPLMRKMRNSVTVS